MKLEQQVCNLELAAKLQELGCEQESSFYWVSILASVWSEEEQAHVTKQQYYLLRGVIEEDKKKDYVYSAYTVAELGKMLPNYILTNGDRIFIDPHIEGHDLSMTQLIRSLPDKMPHEADCRAHIIIFLLENKLITL